VPAPNAPVAAADGLPVESSPSGSNTFLSVGVRTRIWEMPWNRAPRRARHIPGGRGFWPRAEINFSRRLLVLGGAWPSGSALAGSSAALPPLEQRAERPFQRDALNGGRPSKLVALPPRFDDLRAPSVPGRTSCAAPVPFAQWPAA